MGVSVHVSQNRVLLRVNAGAMTIIQVQPPVPQMNQGYPIPTAGLRRGGIVWSLLPFARMNPHLGT